MERHRAIAAADYSDDAVYRSLVEESLEVASMAQSALLWWLRDEGQNIYLIEDHSLLQCHRQFESFLRLRHSRAADDASRRAAAVDLCRARNLLRFDANERDDNGEARLVAFAAGGGSAEDVQLLVAAGADVAAVAAGRSALYYAAQQGHAEAIEALARALIFCRKPIVSKHYLDQALEQCIRQAKPAAKISAVRRIFICNRVNTLPRQAEHYMPRSKLF